MKFDTSSLDKITRATVVDSLRDSDEAQDNAYQITRSPFAAEMRDLFGLIADKIAAEIPITSDEQSLAITALDASIENCLDLGMTSAAGEYEDAKIAIGTLRDLDARS